MQIFFILSLMFCLLSLLRDRRLLLSMANKKLLSQQLVIAGTRVIIHFNSCGATRLDAHASTHRILTYASFGNEVPSPSRLPAFRPSVRPRKPIHLTTCLPRSHHPQLSVKQYLEVTCSPSSVYRDFITLQ